LNTFYIKYFKIGSKVIYSQKILQTLLQSAGNFVRTVVSDQLFIVFEGNCVKNVIFSIINVWITFIN